MNVPLSNPYIDDRDKKIVMEVLNSPSLALGPYLNKFENIFKEYTGLKYAVPVNSGTSGLHLILRAIDFEAGDGMIVTPFTFIASSNVAMYENGTPVFIDIDPYNYNISLEKLEEFFTEGNPVTKKSGYKKISTFMGVDIFGQPIDWDSIMKIIPENIKIVEDSCEALGSEYKNKKAGTYGKAGIYAFYPNKQMTTGEGGIIVTDDEDIYRKCKSMANQGRGDSNQWLDHVRLGYNYRLDEMSAALGYTQMQKIEEILSKREEVSKKYDKIFADEKRLVLPKIESYTTRQSWFVYVIRLDLEWISSLIKLPEWVKNIDIPTYIEESERKEWKGYIDQIKEILDKFLEKLNKYGVQSKNYFSPIHLQKFYREKYGYEEGDYPVTELISSLTVAIPFYTNLQEEQQIYVSETIRRVLGEIENEVRSQA